MDAKTLGAETIIPSDVMEVEQTHGGVTLYAPVKKGGLTKREYFAGLAMMGLLASPDERVQTSGGELRAMWAVSSADDLLVELAKDQP